jgi:hypothetical protein
MARDVTILSSNSQSKYVAITSPYSNVFVFMPYHPKDRDGDSLRDGWSGDRIPVEARFPEPVQTGTVAQPASCTWGTGSFTGVKLSGRGVAHPHLQPRWKKDLVIG